MICSKQFATDAVIGSVRSILKKTKSLKIRDRPIIKYASSAVNYKLNGTPSQGSGPPTAATLNAYWRGENSVVGNAV